MEVHDGNQAQADFWTSAGPLWKELRTQLDAQSDGHGLKAMDALGLATGEAIIDIGCGTGTSSLQLAERVGDRGQVLGIDISSTMIEVATNRAAELGVSNLSFAIGDAHVQHFEPKWNAVFSRFGVMFFADPTAAFANIATALQADGRLGFVCWQSPLKNPWASEPLQAARAHVEFPLGGDPNAPGPFALADPDRVTTILTDAGFTEVDLAGHEAPANLGANLDRAVELMIRINPATASLPASDPSLAATVRAAIEDVLSPYLGDDGVVAQSASWIVTATLPADG